MTNVSISIQPAHRTGFAPIANLIARQNKSPHFRCLHSDEGSAEGALLSMNNYADEGSLAFVSALDKAGRVIGALGAEFDSEQRRAWLWGPFAEHDEMNSEAWLALCIQMHEQLMTALPFEPERLDAFIEEPFKVGARFYRACGYSHAETNYVFVAVRPPEIVAPPQSVFLLTPEFEDGFSKLFDTVFPDTFYTGLQVVDRIGEHEQVFICAKEGSVQGFCHVSINEAANEGYIEFVGVDGQQQGRGIGKKCCKRPCIGCFKSRGCPRSVLQPAITISRHTRYTAGLALNWSIRVWLTGGRGGANA